MKRGLILFLFLACVASASAYIDPGTGSALIGSIWPFILVVLGFIGAFFAKYLFKPIKNAARKAWNLLFKKRG